MKTLKDVQKLLNNISNINHGGCAISALSIYRWLKINNKYNNKVRFVYMYYSEYDFNRNSKALIDKTQTPVACAHCCILYHNKYIDSNGTVDTSRFRYIQHISEEDFLLHSINNIDQWNPSFDRDLIFIIETKLNINLSDVKRFL